MSNGRGETERKDTLFANSTSRVVPSERNTTPRSLSTRELSARRMDLTGASVLNAAWILESSSAFVFDTFEREMGKALESGVPSSRTKYVVSEFQSWDISKNPLQQENYQMWGCVMRREEERRV